MARKMSRKIITFGTMAAKAVLKDAGRALDMPYGDVDKLAKLVPNPQYFRWKRR